MSNTTMNTDDVCSLFSSMINEVEKSSCGTSLSDSFNSQPQFSFAFTLSMFIKHVRSLTLDDPADKKQQYANCN